MSIEQQFHEAMLDIYKLALRDCNYRATRFLQMVANEGGLKTAKKLLADSKVTDGFLTLLEYGRLDLTVESLICTGKFDDLFTNSELEIAQKRLNQYGIVNRNNL